MRALVVLGIATCALIWPAGTPAIIDCWCYDIFRVAPSGADRQRLLPSRGHLLDVSEDGRALYTKQTWTLWAESLVTKRRERVVAERYGTVIHAARWSPEGRSAAYTTEDGDEYVLRVVSHARGIATIARRVASSTIAWSPDSRSVAFVRTMALPNKNAGVVSVVPAAGGEARTLTASLRAPGELAWSPDGSRIAYVADWPRPRAHIVRADGSKDIAIARGTSPHWSPGGRRLQFLWHVGRRVSRVTIINRDGTHPRVIDPKATDPYGQGVGWSPKGAHFVYRRDDGDRMALYIARANGTQRKRLVRGVKNEEFGPIYWTRDGRTIVYTRFIQRGE